MFRYQDEYTFTWPTTIHVPTDGGFQAHELQVTYKLVDADRAEELLKGEDKDLLREVIIGIGPVADCDGKEIPYSEELLEKLLKKPFIRAGLVRTYFEAASGIPRKNSRTPPAGG